MKTYSLSAYVFIVLFLLPSAVFAKENQLPLWNIQSIDTMKTSRDRARVELSNPAFDVQIQKELIAIKETGANYVAIDTPYDKEFLPYLQRWVRLARKTGLRVWFRGNWSSWEGWFDYPKSLTPQNHITKTSFFILDHPELFEDGDIFDACPECENAKYWKQPKDDAEYNAFLRAQQESLAKAFEKIDKKVYSNIASIIGGRAKEVLDKKTMESLRVVAIDHYTKDPKNMGEYVDYFTKNGAKTLVSEFGAPIPDIHGPMNENQQADFVDAVFHELYKKQDDVEGVNYYVLIDGTTAILNEDYTPRSAYYIVKRYFSPNIITGVVTNPLGDRLKDIMFKTQDITVKTNDRGEYTLFIPGRTVTMKTKTADYTNDFEIVKFSGDRQTVQKNFVLTPKKPDLFYKIRLAIQEFFKR